MPEPTATTTLESLRARVLRWITDDPDPASREELYRLLDELPASHPELADRFSGRLTFGTAGLRGPVRAGPAGMNRAVVRAAAAGLVSWLDGKGAAGPVVIGFDARYGSTDFAEETARVVTGSGRRALLMPRPLPTPVLAHAVRALDAVAGVMVTASHNPPADNGYKVYLGAALGGPRGAGAQIVSPVDAEIESAIEKLGPLSKIKLGEAGERLGESIVESYLDGVAAVVDPHNPKALSVVATPMHGVGGATLRDAMVRAGFAAPPLVAEQAEPDPDFPTVAFPNPEEPGAMDLLIALARRTGADLAIALDPDADRCAVAIEDAKGWRGLRGDELGILLADHLIRRGRGGTYATTIVSSSMLRALCEARGVAYEETLTGFKWIVRAADDLAFGYEEAIGYCVAPGHVRDKDGVSAALLTCELAAGLRAQLHNLPDRLDELAREFGVHATSQLSVRVDDLREIADAMARLRANPPKTLLDDPITEHVDLRPEADVVTLRTTNARVVVRPSGTEPKLKAYLEFVEPVADDDIPAARERAAACLEALRTETAAALGL
ncbi:phospho-sugar mutase [Stackebrandtia nassauensis]|uniref:Glucose-1,6-bisphosphate synthase n=1 Tax=Stackebrandtia nassauensis (strain DSM 44728 / CIP 108903 / NRRL B-16338 / NBRC 102104 / LLR-40K-21) TaxID=446470 RepID=D3Q7Y0_STANL|nr:phospho-sugar mutase [Stackebrandtia nassauensis]ADD40485.1 Glucose-1,6-bisphosphate synthase [Stackebrandtia nassauensis DSM 44728]